MQLAVEQFANRFFYWKPNSYDRESITIL